MVSSQFWKFACRRFKEWLRGVKYTVVKESKVETGIPGIFKKSWSFAKITFCCSFEIAFDTEGAITQFRSLVEKLVSDMRGRFYDCNSDFVEKSLVFEVCFDFEGTAKKFRQCIEKAAIDERGKILKSGFRTTETKR